MEEPLDNEYFNWLCAKVIDRTSTNQYVRLLSVLHSTEFVPVIHADTHRAADGVELRIEFFRASFQKIDRSWETLPCSIFEMLVAFAQRASFQTDKPVQDWFMQFLINLGLDKYRFVEDRDIPEIQYVLDNFIYRRYDSRGYGGLFPMPHTPNDQRDIELWYQFYEYLDDQQLV